MSASLSASLSAHLSASLSARTLRRAASLALVLTSLLALPGAPLLADDEAPPPDPPVAEEPAAEGPGAEEEPSAPARTPFAGSATGLAANHANVELTTITHTRGKRPLKILTIYPTKSGRPQTEEDTNWVCLIVAGLSGDRPAEERRIALDAAWLLAEAGDDLPAGVAFQVIADASPDATEAARTAPRAGNDHPVDNDADGKKDEDGPEDLDGDGKISWMRFPDRSGALHEGRPETERDAPAAPEFANPEEGKPRTHGITLEGHDADLDGAWNEDAVGGVDLARNFPWRFQEHVRGSGDWPASEPASRGIMDLLVADERIALVCELGAADIVVGMPGWTPSWVKLPREDLKTYAGLRTLWGKPEGPESPATAPGPGSFGGTVVHQFGRIWMGRSPLGRSGSMWPTEGARWPGYLKLRWRPLTAEGVPPGAELATVEGELPPTAPEGARLAAFAQACAADRAQIEFVETKTLGKGGLLGIRAHILNTGRLPTHLKRAANVRGRRPLNIRVVLPAEAQLISGAELVQIERLGPGAKSDELRYVVSGPTGTTITIEVTGPDTGTVRRDFVIP